MTSPHDVLPSSPRDVLSAVFGFEEFRPGQEAVVDRLLAGRSVLAIFPTGGGKSLCYQLPALLLEGITIVVSPLIALMKDQIDVLVARGVAAARLNSSVDAAGARETYGRLNRGELKLLYIAPERLANERFLATLSRLPIALMAIDEAHCISEWGHNFRPDYLKLAPLAARLGVQRVLGLTATATPVVAEQVAAAFAIAQDDVVRTPFYRPNLSIDVTPVTAARRTHTLVERLRTGPVGPTIVYVTLQRTAEEVAEALGGAGFDATAYHAGMDPDDRHRVQEAFMASASKVIVATIAFGMGIDKADIRAVYHYNLPKSLENYAQEIGRAGRDGLPSTCALFVCGDDIATLENFTFGDTPTPEAVDALAAVLFRLGDRFDISVNELSAEHDTRPLVVQTLITYLELDGYLEPTGPFYNEYRFQATRPMEDILADFDAGRADFLRRLFATAKKARTWSSIDLHSAAAAIGETRDRAVKAITWLEERGDLVLKVAGVRNGYRVLRRPDDVGALSVALHGRFLEREGRDIDRLGEVLRFATREGCHTRALLEYFHEPLEGDCGHCGWCRGERRGALPPAPERPLGDREATIVREVRSEQHAALARPRQLARFLCGITSPAVSQARLGRHAHFGALAGVPFRSVLRLCEGEGDRSQA